MIRFKQYHLTIGNSSSSYTLVYELEQHRPAQEWARLMLYLDASMLRENFNPWAGSTSNEKRTATTKRLIELIESLNQWIPNKIETQWDVSDFQNTLNKLHIHFPELEQSEKDPVRLSQLTEYNDTIHLLEHLYRNTDSERLMLMILPSMIESVPLKDDEYTLFNPNVKFGEMVLHYPLVGRNVFELLRAKDYNCPVDQIRPQNIITAYHHLRFFNDPTDDVSYRASFARFYDKSTIKEKYNIDDPKLAFGFIKIGRLVSDLSNEEILKIVMSCDRIISWEIKH